MSDVVHISLKEVIARARRTYHDVTRQASKRAAELQTTCTKGCAACCYQLVGCSFVEAFVLAEEVHRTRSREQQDALLVALDKHIEMLKQPDARSRLFFSGNACPLLNVDPDDRHRGLCTAYASRPLACRLQFVVTDPKLCQTDAIHDVAMVDTTVVQLRAMQVISGEVPLLVAYAPLQALLAHALRCLRGEDTPSLLYVEEWGARMRGYLEHEARVQAETGKKDTYVP
jgi:Fe-S-cluster containining protein